MNLSRLLNISRDEDNQEIIFLMNYIFDGLKNRKLEKLSDIVDEKRIQLLLLEM
jgi:hypothetical protein